MKRVQKVIFSGSGSLIEVVCIICIGWIVPSFPNLGVGPFFGHAELVVEVLFIERVSEWKLRVGFLELLKLNAGGVTPLGGPK
jgi:hypothetical protein